MMFNPRTGLVRSILQTQQNIPPLTSNDNARQADVRGILTTEQNNFYSTTTRNNRRRIKTGYGQFQIVRLTGFYLPAGHYHLCWINKNVTNSTRGMLQLKDEPYGARTDQLCGRIPIKQHAFNVSGVLDCFWKGAAQLTNVAELGGRANLTVSPPIEIRGFDFRSDDAFAIAKHGLCNDSSMRLSSETLLRNAKIESFALQKKYSTSFMHSAGRDTVYYPTAFYLAEPGAYTLCYNMYSGIGWERIGRCPILLNRGFTNYSIHSDRSGMLFPSCNATIVMDAFGLTKELYWVLSRSPDCSKGSWVGADDFTGYSDTNFMTISDFVNVPIQHTDKLNFRIVKAPAATAWWPGQHLVANMLTALQKKVHALCPRRVQSGGRYTRGKTQLGQSYIIGGDINVLFRPDPGITKGRYVFPLAFDSAYRCDIKNISTVRNSLLPGRYYVCASRHQPNSTIRDSFYLMNNTVATSSAPTDQHFTVRGLTEVIIESYTTYAFNPDRLNVRVEAKHAYATEPFDPYHPRLGTA